MQITNAGDIKRNERFNILIYAEPGAGKTSTLQYLTGKTLVLDIDGTSRVLSGLTDIDVAEINPENVSKDMLDFYTLAKSKIKEYDNIVLDNLSHYQKLWLMEKGRNTKSGQPELQHYGIFDTHLIDLISTFNSLDANVVYTAWEGTRQIQLESGQLYNQFLPDIRDKVVNHIMGIVPVVARLVRNPETKQRGFILQKSNGTFAKNQLDDREGCLQENIFNIGSEDETV
ncbi:AAA family ATPase [Vagococcus fluvialis]|uniref:AAA family ATPase n=1 Tax=Vagococcus fluvialis TaxID=2738 RepID=UPI00289229DF|nr:AAA family ATPase [Vagococcus fluvialis]MDT2783006.1 AAA family ATPase [Vagococcus fluvialis]